MLTCATSTIVSRSQDGAARGELEYLRVAAMETRLMMGGRKCEPGSGVGDSVVGAAEESHGGLNGFGALLDSSANGAPSLGSSNAAKPRLVHTHRSPVHPNCQYVVASPQAAHTDVCEDDRLNYLQGRCMLAALVWWVLSSVDLRYCFRPTVIAMQGTSRGCGHTELGMDPLLTTTPTSLYVSGPNKTINSL